MASKQQGFSLIELTVAMTVTLIITGAMFQLLTAGKSAFRREPELSARQQNIRVAMDVISQDVYRAGQGLPEFAQVFTRNLNGVGPMGSGGAASDALELVVDVRVRGGGDLRRERDTAHHEADAGRLLRVSVDGHSGERAGVAHHVGGGARRRDEQLVRGWERWRRE